VRVVPADRLTVVALVAALAVPARAAAADTGPAPTAVEDAASTEVLDAATDYFTGERAQGAAWGAVGAIAIAGGVVALASDDDLAHGAAYPLLAVGAIQLGAGVVSYVSPPRRLRRARTAIGRDARTYAEGERRRMGKVTFAFDALRVTEVALVAIGAGLAIGGARAERDVLVGIGGGIAFQALAMLALDGVADARAARYVERLSIALGHDSAAVGYAAPF